MWVSTVEQTSLFRTVTEEDDRTQNKQIHRTNRYTEQCAMGALPL